MSVSKSRGRRVSCQGCNFYGYEQSTSKRQGNKSYERGGKTGHSGISAEPSES